MTNKQLREIADEVAKAHAALTAVANGYAHDGEPLGNDAGEKVLAAFAHIDVAASLMAGIVGGNYEP